MFDDACLKDFECLKEMLVSHPVIISPDWTLSFKVMWDDKGIVLGDVLFQRGDKTLYPIFILEKHLTPHRKITQLLSRSCLRCIFF